MCFPRRRLLAVLPTLVAVTQLLSPAVAQHVVKEDPLTAAQQRTKFHLPPGFEIQLVAAEPDIAKPINLNFDSGGRLVVTQSVEYPYPAKGQGRDAVMRLSIDPATGMAARIERLVDGLNIPIGVEAMPDGAIVFSIPNLLRCRDTTGDGKLDRRDVLFGPFGHDDTHGLNNNLTRWIDGWVYACHGFRNTSSVAGRDGHRVTMNSGNTYRFRADGSRIEQYTWGQVNPFGLCFDALGNAYTADCHTKPAYMILRGAYYPSFGKPHDGLGFGPELVRHSHGSTGIAGIVYYDADHFPAKYRDTIFIGNPITRRVNHDRLQRNGSSYHGVEQPDFITCDDNWFRPVDLQMGPDGALYIADFYNRIIGHYEVPLNHPGRDRHRGRIWRVVYRGIKEKPARPPRIPDLSKADAKALIAHLGDVNLRLCTLATNELVDRIGKKAVAPLRELLNSSDAPPRARAHALWAVERLAGLDEELIGRLAKGEPLVRVHLVKALGERATWDEANGKLARAMLGDADPFVRRAAADALGRHPHPESVQPLLESWAKTPADDTHLVHVTRMALRDQLLNEHVQARLDKSLYADKAHLARLLDVSLGARTPRSALLVLRAVVSGEVDERGIERFLHHAIRYVADDQLAEAVQAVRRFEKRDAAVQLAALTTLRRALEERGKPLPREFTDWAVRLGGELLRHEQADQVRRGVDLARQLKLKSLYPQLAGLARTGRESLAPLRGDAVDACAACDAGRSVALAAAILRGGSEPLPLRQKAAAVLAQINSPDSRDAIRESFKTVPRTVALACARSLVASREGSRTLLDALTSGTASRRLLTDRNVRERLSASGIAGVKEKIADLSKGLAPRDDRLAKLIAARRDGYRRARPDAALGRAVFEKNCAACHRVGETGKKIGPELDGIGHRGLERVLEDVLDPSRNVDAAFRTTTVVTTAGRVVSGLLLRKEGQTLILADAEGKEIRLPAAEVDELHVSPLSPMPANVEQLIKEPDFHHLMAFLLSQRAADAPPSK